MKYFAVMFVDGNGKSQYERVRAMDDNDAVAKLSVVWKISKVISIRS